MDLNLKGKIAVVSGSSRGIGKAVAGGLLAEGAVVYVTGRNEPDLNAACSEFQARFGERVYKFNGDLTDTETIKKLLAEIIARHERLDIAVANIGSGRFRRDWDIADELLMKSFDLNLFAAVRLSREAIRVMIGRKSGAVVCVASIAGGEAIPAPVQYSAAKSALLSYVKNTADLVAPFGIRINAISPGNVYFEGGTWDAKIKENREAVEAYIRSSVPMGRLGLPGEIADAACFLVSERASFVTGANIIIDGGQTRKIF